jgi:hypothetical protein
VRIGATFRNGDSLAGDAHLVQPGRERRGATVTGARSIRSKLLARDDAERAKVLAAYLAAEGAFDEQGDRLGSFLYTPDRRERHAAILRGRSRLARRR